jgi:hypothetical protein
MRAVAAEGTFSRPGRCTVQKKMAVVFVALTAVLAVISTVRAQSSEPSIRTWKVNLAKSTYSPGPKPTVAAAVQVEPSAGGIKTTIDSTNAQSQPVHTETVGDAKHNPVKGAQATNTTIAYKRVDGRTYDAIGEIYGKPTVTIAISADGKTMTATQTGENAEGQNVHNVLVADKQ